MNKKIFILRIIMIVLIISFIIFTFVANPNSEYFKLSILSSLFQFQDAVTEDIHTEGIFYVFEQIDDYKGKKLSLTINGDDVKEAIYKGRLLGTYYFERMGLIYKVKLNEQEYKIY